MPRLIIPGAASACSPQLRTLLLTLSLAAAGCDPQQEPLKTLSPWVREQRSLRWASLWSSAASHLGKGGEGLAETGRHPPASWTPWLVLVAAGGYSTTAAAFFSSIWKGSRFCQGMAREGEENSERSENVPQSRAKEFSSWGYLRYFMCDSRAI